MPDQDNDRYFDTVTLSNFILAGRFDLLSHRYRDSMRVTEQVRSELAAGRAVGHHVLGAVESALAEGAFPPVSPMTWSEHGTFSGLLGALGAGEASCITFAKHRGGIVVSDDRAARNLCRDLSLPVTGTIGILKALSADTIITVEDADAILTRMIELGFYSPVRRISDLRAEGR